MHHERPVAFPCDEAQLVGIIHPVTCDAHTGIVIVVGGPQYRVGSHRQFVIMARQFAAAGIPVLRFDYRGMGDSQADVRPFDQVDRDIRAAIDAMIAAFPHVTNIVLLGLCDAASASMMYAHTDHRVQGLVLLNPWVRTLVGEAKAYLRYYYLQRIFQKAFWAKVGAGQVSIGRSLRELLHTRRTAADSRNDRALDHPTDSGFISRMLTGLVEFHGPILFLMSGRDLTAQEFMDLCRDNADFHKATERAQCELCMIRAADHTLSRRQDLDSANLKIVEWLNRAFPAALK